MSDEVELQTDAGEYEVVPIGPIRRLERRMERLETSGGTSRNEDLIHDVLDIMKANQKIVNDVVESTSQLRNSIMDLTGRLNEVITNMNDFMGLLREASEASLETEISQDIGQNVISPIATQIGGLSTHMETMAKSVKDSNEALIEGLDRLDKRLKRIYATQSRGKVLSRTAR